MLFAKFGWNLPSGSIEEDIFFNFVNVFSLFRNNLPLENGVPFILINLCTLHPRMIYAKFDWNWHSGSGEEDFLKLQMYFHYFVIISPWEKKGSFI